MRNNQSRTGDKASCRVCSGESMSIAAEMQGLVFEAAEPVSPGDTVKAQQRRAWEALHRPPFWRLRAAWYGEAGCWSARAVEDMRRRAATRQAREAKAREHAQGLAELYATIAERLRASPDAGFHRDDIAGLLHAARALGGVDSAVAEEED